MWVKSASSDSFLSMTSVRCLVVTEAVFVFGLNRGGLETRDVFVWSFSCAPWGQQVLRVWAGTCSHGCLSAVAVCLSL